jgi:glutathione S-transferase
VLAEKGVEKGVAFTRRDVFSIVDAAFAPVFRYFDVIDQFVDLQLLAKTPAVRAWRTALARRASAERSRR